jgi:undecaprenyl-diphosphatase
MYKIDSAVTQWINNLAGGNAALDLFMIAISLVGVPILVLAVVIQWWLPEHNLTKRHTLVAAGFSFLLGLTLNQIVLLFVHRIRPYESGLTHLLIGPSSDYSFPSDHATAAFAIAAAFLLHGKRGVGIAFLAAALFMIVSRVYVGTHYASDVLGGAVTGILAAVAVRVVYRAGTKLDRIITNLL